VAKEPDECEERPVVLSKLDSIFVDYYVLSQYFDGDAEARIFSDIASQNRVQFSQLLSNSDIVSISQLNVSESDDFIWGTPLFGDEYSLYGHDGNQLLSQVRRNISSNG